MIMLISRGVAKGGRRKCHIPQWPVCRKLSAQQKSCRQSFALGNYQTIHSWVKFRTLNRDIILQLSDARQVTNCWWLRQVFFHSTWISFNREQPLVSLPFVRMLETVKNYKHLKSFELLIPVWVFYVLFRKMDCRKQLSCFVPFQDHAYFVAKI